MAKGRIPSPAELVASHLDKRPRTKEAYRRDLLAFAKWRGHKSLSAAAHALIVEGRPTCRRLLLSWVTAMTNAGLSSNTIRRRIASVRSMLRLAVDFEIMDWDVGRISLPPSRRVRDCRGPSRDAVERMMDVCRQRDDAKGKRDLAIIRMLYLHALRASELLGLGVADIALGVADRAARITSKGGHGKVEIGLSRAAADAISGWLDARGHDHPALFTTCERHGTAEPRPLSYSGLRRVVHDLGKAVGVRCWCHALRHAALTHLAQLTNSSPTWGCALSRHNDIRAWATYQDHPISHVNASEVLSKGQVVATNRCPDW